MDTRWRRLIRPAVIAVLAIVYLLGAYIYGRRHNREFLNTDQNAYLNEIRELKDSDYSRLTQRSRMPVYLYLQSMVARKGMSSAALFPRAKTVNLIVSAVGLIGVWAILMRVLPRVAAENLVLITAFTVYVFRAPYVYAELLYYTLFFAAMVLMLALFPRPRFVTAAIAGVVLAVAHLTKASTVPAVVLFVVIYLASAIIARAKVLRAIGICAVLVMAYLATLSPYLIHSKRAFGEYFYNVNTTLYVWCDSWQEVCDGPKAHGDRRHWPTMPAAEVPSVGKYVRDHGVWHIAVMTGIGVKKLLYEAVNSSGFTKYVVVNAVFLAWLVLANREWVRIWLKRPGMAGAGSFLLACVLVYFLAISFYLKITQPAMRFMLAIFLPGMMGMEYLMMSEEMKPASVRVGKWRVDAEKFQWALRGMILANVVVSVIPRLMMAKGR